MENTDLTVEILKGIREDMRGLRSEVHETNARLDALRDNFGQRLDALALRSTEAEIRTATAMTDLAGTVRELTGVLRAQHDLRPRVERCELDIVELRRRIG